MYRSDKEICAGFKIPYPKMRVYVRKKSRGAGNGTKIRSSETQNYVFKYVAEQKNPVSSLVLKKRVIDCKN